MTHSFPTRRSSDLSTAKARSRLSLSDMAATGTTTSGMLTPLRLESAPPTSTTVSIRSDVTDLTRSEEHTSELQSLMRISYAVFCLKTTTLRQPKIEHHEHSGTIIICNKYIA